MPAGILVSTMQTEIEAKFLEIDVGQLRADLRGLGATCVQPMRLMKRKNFDYPDHRLEKVGAWVRIRDEGDKTTLSYKQLAERTVQGTKEINLVIDDFDSATGILEAIGLHQTSYQETRRESWVLDGSQIELDEWPWAKPYLEIEADSEARIIATAKLLGLKMDEAVYGSVEIVYMNEFDITEAEVNATPIITFSDKPDWISKRRKV